MRHVSPGSDMHQILFVFGIKAVAAGEVEKRRVDLFKIPRIVYLDSMRAYFGLRRKQGDIFDQLLRQAFIVRLVDELQPVDRKIGLLA